MLIHKKDELIKDTDKALEYLKKGNRRFVENRLYSKHNYKKDRDILAEAQKPFAVVVCCSDSRVAPEIFFDQELGDIFVVRNAGNVVDDVALGSFEYAVEQLGSPLVVVCGHSACGAVTAAVTGGEFSDNLKAITDIIGHSVPEGASVDEAIKSHALEMVQVVKQNEIVKQFSAQVVGAYYDIHTGEVSWL